MSLIIAPKSPALPLPAASYDARYLNQFLLTLRLYFNELDSTLRSLINATSYGSFYDTTTQTLGAINTATALVFGQTLSSENVSVGLSLIHI